MPLGWIDYSKSDRNKALSVLDLLSEPGTLDELGIAPVRDGFANLFFPGTSTIQTRAKYFFIIPYSFKDLEYSNENQPGRIIKELDKTERECGEILMSIDPSELGIIGQRSLQHGTWVKRSPSDIYWAGLRRYGIFCGGNLTISEYIRAMCGLKRAKGSLISLGNRNDQAESFEKDDKDAVNQFRMQFWKMPLYEEDWKDTLKLQLSKEEGEFLNRQIVNTCPDSLLAFILKNNRNDLLEAKLFRDLAPYVHSLPARIREDYDLAARFSDFVYVLRIVFNLIVSNGENTKAQDEWNAYRSRLRIVSKIDIDKIFKRLELLNNPRLKAFLLKAQVKMAAKDLDGLKRLVRDRERDLKGVYRARTMHPGEFGIENWFCGEQLDYRFSNAKTIIQDIFESVNVC